MMADMVEAAMSHNWDRDRAVNYMLENHTWSQRIDTYDRVIKGELGMD